MSRDYQVVPAKITHIRPMARHIRAAAAITLQGFGYNPREALRRAYVTSPYCRTALQDGRPIAMWGVKGSLLDTTGFAWLVLSQAVTHIPAAVVREARAELAAMMVGVDEIAITVLPDDEAAIRFACYLGFHDREEEMSRKDLARAIRADPKYRIPVGDSYVIAMGYHPTIPHEARP